MSKKKTKTELFYEALDEVMNIKDLLKDYKNSGIEAFESRFDDIKHFLNSQTITKRPPVKPSFDGIPNVLARRFLFELAKTDEVFLYDNSDNFRLALVEEMTHIFTIKGIRGRRVSDIGTKIEEWFWEFGMDGVKGYFLSRRKEKGHVHKLLLAKKKIEEIGLEKELEESLILNVVNNTKLPELKTDITDYGYIKRRTGMEFRRFNGYIVGDVKIEIDYERVKRIEEGKRRNGKIKLIENTEVKQLELF